VFVKNDFLYIFHSFISSGHGFRIFLSLALLSGLPREKASCSHGLGRLAGTGSFLSFQKILDKRDHLMLFDKSISILIDLNEGLLEPALVVVVRWWAILEDYLQEASSLILVKLSAIVCVELHPDLIDGLSVDAIIFILFGDLAGERAVSLKDLVVNEHLNVRGETLPNDRSLIVQSLAIDHNDLLGAFRDLRRGSAIFSGCCAIVELKLWLDGLGSGNIYADLATAHVL